MIITLSLTPTGWTATFKGPDRCLKTLRCLSLGRLKRAAIMSLPICSAVSLRRAFANHTRKKSQP
jgi:hypothetical protein